MRPVAKTRTVVQKCVASDGVKFSRLFGKEQNPTMSVTRFYPAVPNLLPSITKYASPIIVEAIANQNDVRYASQELRRIFFLVTSPSHGDLWVDVIP